jgi:hypothetical protein
MPFFSSAVTAEPEAEIDDTDGSARMALVGYQRLPGDGDVVTELRGAIGCPSTDPGHAWPPDWESRQALRLGRSFQGPMGLAL